VAAGKLGALVLTMHNIKDDIKIVSGNKKTLQKAKFLAGKRKVKSILSDLKWKILVILNGFKF
jgi:hypothetical protein